MATSFLHWNINRKAGFENEVAKLVNMDDIKADILLLVEAENVDDNEINKLTGLTRLKVEDWKETELTPRFYSKLPLDVFQLFEIHDSSRYVFARLNIAEEKEIIICGLHIPSKLTVNEKTQYSDARQIALFISDMKTRSNVGHNRFLVFGDFNMNPFEPGMIEPDGFNAVLSTTEALNEQRTEFYKKFDYFYNPMWSYLGDRNYLTGDLKLAGSYYFRKTRDVTLTFWNVFDKVIIRPSIIDIFDFSSIKIIDDNGIEKLVTTDFQLRDDSFSDHLPLTFKLFI
ncbi:endonuclease/exonuclease/phosphatase family protein [Mongoliitalea lutea]|uniref:Endonuclease/Exonuclease/phosphatase family protein n=1 Tax=Mongoliitalea lutea TaxID=849756 RepID=A0A8J3D1G7_9BACT|nr:endonuclease/exonuclease/phosphatase family protein [Mongoliitalea lutea]GHB49098.1 hypothetical protein GCM10008106_32350 [Mongoliitalea lutea]